MNEEEYQEQLRSATQFIKDSVQESNDFKSGGQSYEKAAEEFKTAAETYKTLNDKAIEIMSKRPEAVVPDSVYQAIQRIASEGVRSEKCQTPTSEDMVSVLREAYKKVSPEITYKRVFNVSGKKCLFIAVVLCILCGIKTVRDIYVRNSFDGTAESWANRMYVASKESGEKNPGAGYDEVMTAFSNGNAENAKELVIRKENKLAELQEHRRKFEGRISEYLSKDYPSGIRIVEFEETTGHRYSNDLFGRRTSKDYNFIYAKIIVLDENLEFRVAMERQAGFLWENDPWDIYITEDKRINSVSDYRNKASVVNWKYNQKKAIPWCLRECL